MALRRIRTLAQAVNEIKKQDPDFPITKSKLYRMACEAKFPTWIESGRIYVDMDELEKFFNDAVR